MKVFMHQQVQEQSHLLLLRQQVTKQDQMELQQQHIQQAARQINCTQLQANVNYYKIMVIQTLKQVAEHLFTVTKQTNMVWLRLTHS